MMRWPHMHCILTNPFLTPKQKCSPTDFLNISHCVSHVIYALTKRESIFSIPAPPYSFRSLVWLKDHSFFALPPPPSRQKAYMSAFRHVRWCTSLLIDIPARVILKKRRDISPLRDLKFWYIVVGTKRQCFNRGDDSGRRPNMKKSKLWCTVLLLC